MNLPRYRRPHVSRLLDLLSEDGPMRLVAVTGPRQTGKTTIVLQALDALERRGIRECAYVAVDDPAPEASPLSIQLAPAVPLAPGSAPGPDWLVAVWQRARALADRSRQGVVVALDEIHRIPSWSATVKGLWDGDRRVGRPLRVVILGSAPWKIMTGIHESLAGRFDPFPVRHWSLTEMQDAFGVAVEDYIRLGGYPGAAVHADDPERWQHYISRAIVGPAIERDILSLTQVKKPALMRSLMDLATEYSGQVISYNKLQGQLDDAGNATTVAGYLDLLADAGLVVGLEMHGGLAHKTRRSTPKLCVLNTSLMTAAYPYGPERTRHDSTFWGRLSESAVGAHLHNTLPSSGTMKLRYWRRRSREVDFVVARGRELVGIEVKSGRNSGNLAGLDAFCDQFKRARRLLVGTGGVSFADFLKEPATFWMEEAGREV